MQIPNSTINTAQLANNASASVQNVQSVNGTNQVGAEQSRVRQLEQNETRQDNRQTQQNQQQRLDIDQNAIAAVEQERQAREQQAQRELAAQQQIREQQSTQQQNTQNERLQQTQQSADQEQIQQQAIEAEREDVTVQQSARATTEEQQAQTGQTSGQQNANVQEPGVQGQAATGVDNLSNSVEQNDNRELDSNQQNQQAQQVAVNPNQVTANPTSGSSDSRVETNAQGQATSGNATEFNGQAQASSQEQAQTLGQQAELAGRNQNSNQETLSVETAAVAARSFTAENNVAVGAGAPANTNGVTSGEFIAADNQVAIASANASEQVVGANRFAVERGNERNQTAIDLYQTVGNLAQRESVQQLFGVNLTA